jgi:hypothetical protein
MREPPSIGGHHPLDLSVAAAPSALMSSPTSNKYVLDFYLPRRRNIADGKRERGAARLHVHIARAE